MSKPTIIHDLPGERVDVFLKVHGRLPTEPGDSILPSAPSPTAEEQWDPDVEQSPYWKADHAGRLISEYELVRGQLLAMLYYHQGFSSNVGQPIRKALGIAPDAHMTPEQLQAARAWLKGRTNG